MFHFTSPDVPEYAGHTGDSGLEVIASGDHFLLAWTSVTGSTEQLHLARLSSTLALLDPSGVLVATQPFPQIGLVARRVALGWDGNYDWVVWTDGEGGARSPFASLRGRRFSANLTPADEEPFLIASDLDETTKVTLAVGQAGRSLVGYTRYLPSDYSYRVRARLLGSTPFADGVPCSDAGQCEGGFCVAGVCSAASGSGGAANGGSGGNSGADGPPGGAESGGTAGRGGTVGTTGGDGFAGAVEATAGDIGSGGAVASGAGGEDIVVDGGDGGNVISAAGKAGGNAGGGSRGHSCSIPVVGADSSGEGLVSFAALVSALCGLRRRKQAHLRSSRGQK